MAPRAASPSAATPSSGARLTSPASTKYFPSHTPDVNVPAAGERYEGLLGDGLKSKPLLQVSSSSSAAARRAAPPPQGPRCRIESP
jgi:hypothetical protein